MHPGYRLLALGISALLLLPMVLAAQLSGETYNGITLETIKNVRVVMGANPPIQTIASEGKYSLEIGPGTYSVHAIYSENGVETLTAQETITIPGNENYTYDLILFPPVEKTIIKSLPAEAEITPDIGATLQQPITLLFIVGLLFLAIEAAIIITRENKAPVSEPPYQIMEINNMLPALPKEVKPKKKNKKKTKQTRLTT